MLNWIVWNRTVLHFTVCKRKAGRKLKMISITIAIHYGRLERVYFFPPSVLGDMTRETQIIKTYTNHTVVTSHPNGRHILWYVRFQLISAGRDPKNLIWSDRIRKTQLLPSTVDLNLIAFSKFSTTLSIHSNARRSHFQSVGLLWQMMIVISFPCRRKSAHLTMHLN